MTRITRAVAHLPEEEVKRRMKHELRPWYRVRWLIIYNALVDPRKAEEIAKHCGESSATVHQVISTYNRLGAEAVETCDSTAVLSSLATHKLSNDWPVRPF